MKDLLQIIPTVILITLTTGGLIALAFRTYLVATITQRVKIDYDKEFETFKSQLNKDQANLTRILESQNQGYHLSQSERLSAVKEFWKFYIKLRGSIQIIAELDSFLLPDEMRTINLNEKGFERLKQGIDNSNLKAHNDAYADIELLRPFLNEEIWKQISFLSFFCGRLFFLYVTRVAENKSIYWHDDEYLVTTTIQNITKDEAKYLKSVNIGKIKLVLLFTETKILKEIDNILTGKAAANFTMQHAIDMLKFTNDKKIQW